MTLKPIHKESYPLRQFVKHEILSIQFFLLSRFMKSKPFVMDGGEKNDGTSK